MSTDTPTQNVQKTSKLQTFTFTVKLAGGATKTLTAFKRKSEAAWTIKPRVDGKQRWISLAVYGDSKNDLELLKKRAMLKMQEIVDKRFAPICEAKVRNVKPVTIGEVIAAYEGGIRIETTIKPGTMADAVGALRILGREISGFAVEAVDTLTLAVLEPEKVERWQDGRRREALKLDSVSQGRANRCMDGILRKARSMFTPAAMHCYRKAGLTLPDLQGFRSVGMKGDWNTTGYVPIDEVTMERMNRAAWEQLKVKNPRAFVAFLLMLRCGVRNREAQHARRCWIERSKAVVMIDGKPQLQEVAFLAVIARPATSSELEELGKGTDRDLALWEGPKNGKDHRIPLAPDVLAALEELAGEDYLVAGAPSVRYDITHRDVCDFVRGFLPGLEADPERGRVKAAYELRKHFGAIVASTQGLDRAAEYLGDRRDTVEKHYHAWLQHRTARPMLASELTPNVLAAVA